MLLVKIEQPKVILLLFKHMKDSEKMVCNNIKLNKKVIKKNDFINVVRYEKDYIDLSQELVFKDEDNKLKLEVCERNLIIFS